MAIGNAIRLAENIQGLIYFGIANGMSASTTTIVVPDLVSLGNNNANDFFNTDFVMIVLKNANSVGNAPEGEIRDITDYVAATGTFTATAFSQNVENGDELMIIRRELCTVDGVALKTTPATNSLAYRLSQYLASGDGDWAGGQALPSNVSLVDLFGDFTGPHDGAAQEDNVKASLDLAHTDLDAVLADTNELQTDWTDGGRLDLILDELTTQGDTNETKLDTIDDFLDTEVADILADTNELQVDWTNGGRLDLIIDELTTQGDTNEGKIDTIDGFHDVPSQDSVDNAQARDVIGNKTDTVGGDSVVALAKQIVADTGELQTDWVNGGRLDLIVDELTTQGDTNEGKIDTIDTVVDANQDFLDGTTATPTAYRREHGRTQIIEVSITAAANAGVTTVATVTTQPCLIKSTVIHADAAQTADMTSCALEGGVSQVVEFISAATAVQASLDAADKQVSATGTWRLAATKTIAIDLQGTGATAVDLTVTIEYEACVDGGYLV